MIYKQIRNITVCTLTMVLLGIGMNPVYAKGLSNDKKFGYSHRYGVVTPTQVYSLLKNLETALMVYIKSHKKGLVSGANAIKLKSVSGKTPADAFKALNSLGDSIDILVKTQDIHPVPRVKQEKKKVLPAEVFLQTGNNLDTFIDFLARLEPDNRWGDIYVVNRYKKSKKPNDVYALAMLLKRRLDYTMAR